MQWVLEEQDPGSGAVRLAAGHSPSQTGMACIRAVDFPRRWGQHPTGMLVTGSEVEGRVLGSRAGKVAGQLESGHSPVLHTGVDF